MSVLDRINLVFDGDDDVVVSQAESRTVALGLELVHQTKDDFSRDEVDDDDVALAGRHGAHHETAVVQMTSADDLGVVDVHRADHVSVGQIVQMNLIGKNFIDHFGLIG